ncbi:MULTISPECIES: SDR family NAD(P)-dependent oxidoreductase [Mesorhizobium]|uniref:SDR family oxidoreductase n=1 Tax=Mesorhizobium denitrificans TaxID=2294114 RepID=A0A371XCG8_9HYPH|nr:MULTISPECIES: SDR family NAD(P)-dependent oxidoreductase [Mesorhizobium]RFC66911.1 SDR family oxidoreductase [Mesorhizobium denitrificans]
MSRRFEGMTVLLTGATGGFGCRSAERFAAEGARLVLSDLDEKPLQELASRLDCETEILAGDITDEKLSEALVKLALSKFGQLDVALNNAGIVHSFVSLANLPTEEARRVIDVNLLGVFYAMKYQLPAMSRQFRETKRPGAVVNIGSSAGLSAAPKMALYAAAKHGVIGLTKTAAIEYASKGIRVNAVCPSYARTPMAQSFLKITKASEEAAYAELTRSVPMKRLAEVDEVVEAIMFAADPKNSFMTGASIPVDGGVSAI